jgi:hypothetical protein
MQKKVILINGPPGSGKDTATAFAKAAIDGKPSRGKFVGHDVAHLKFADPLKAAAHVLYGIPHSADYYEKEFGYEWKNNPQPEFFGLIPRSVYISLSEEYAKEKGGASFFGKIAARRIRLDKRNDVFIFSDSGFADEAIPVIREVGIDNVLLISLERSGHNFAGDSRGYISGTLCVQYPKLNHVRLPNNQDKMLLRTLIRGTVQPWLDIEDGH